MKNFIILCFIAFILFSLFNKSSSKKRSSAGNDNLSSKIEIISYGGENVSLSSNAVKGGITIFDFYADWCGPCKSLSSKLEPYVKSTSGVYLKKINIKDWDSAVAKYYQVESIPSVWIYDQNGNEVRTKLNNFEAIKNAVEKL